MAGLHFEFVSPENVLFSGDVDQVDLPGIEGDLGVLPGHAPMVTTLRPGVVTIIREGRREAVVVVGGFAEMGPAGLPRKTSPTAPMTRSVTNWSAASINYVRCRRPWLIKAYFAAPAYLANSATTRS